MASIWLAVFLISWCQIVDGAEENNEFLEAARRVEVFPILPITAPRSKNEHCRKDSQLLLENIRNQTTWAMQMWDATAKGAVGAYSGSIYQLGDFDECVGTVTPVRGQYCLASVNVAQPNAPPIDRGSNIYRPDASIWNKIRYKSDPTKVHRDTIHWALCVPASCTHNDIQASVNDHLVATSDNESVTSLKVVVPAALCQTNRQGESLTTGSLIYCCVVAAIFAVVLLTTVYDFVCYGVKGDTEDLKPCDTGYLLSFSLKRNFPEFMSYKTSDQSIDCLHGIRVIANILVIAGHRIGFPMSGPIQNFEYIESYDQQYTSTIFYQGQLLIDIFFLMSGLLVTYVLLIQLDKRSINPFIVIFVRYIRLTPVYMAVIFFHATLMNYVGDGPIWPQVIEPERDACLENWWLNLLYINNYVGNDNLCVLHSWYLPCDFHFFLFAVFFVHLIHKHPTAGAFLLAGLTVTSVIVPFAITWLQRQPPLMYFNLEFLEKPRSHEFFRAVYMKSHARASAYLVGVATGYLLYKTRNHRAQHTLLPTFGYIISLVICVTTLVPAKWFLDHTWEYDVLIASFYAGLHRLWWTLGVAIFIISVVYSKRSLFGALLSWAPLIVLSKLVYCVYLVHLPVQQVQFASQRRAVHISFISQVRQITADTAFSVGIAVILHLTIEVPTRLICKRLFESQRKIAPASSTVVLKHFGTSQTSIVD